MRCKNCHYSLKNLTVHRCPECGTAFDPNDPSTFVAAVREGARLRHLVVSWFIAFVLGCVLAFGFFVPRPVGVEELPVGIFGAFAIAMFVTGIVWPVYVFIAAWWESH